MATSSSSTATWGGNPYYEPVSGNNATKDMISSYNTLASQGNQAFGTGSNLLSGAAPTIQAGQGTVSAGVNAMSPALQYLTQLTKGDQADLSQATQSQTNQIQDSFAAIRNMISAQPRGGGKAGALAEAPYKQQQQIGDMQQQARAGAANQLGQLSSTLAGIGLEQSGVGIQEQGLGEAEQGLGEQAASAAGTETLQRKNADIQGGISATFSNVASALSDLI